MKQAYFELPVSQVSQLSSDGPTYAGKITFARLLKIHKLTERQVSVKDPFSKEKQLAEEEEFQRHLNPDKLRKIAKYIEKSLEGISSRSAPNVGVFHTSIILGLQFDSELELEKAGVMDIDPDESKFCYLNQDGTKLFIPECEDVALIIDGQHRFCGLKEFYENTTSEEHKRLVESFEFPVTFLLGLDMYNLGRAFATINFNQKPVNRSLYYDIFGSIPDPEKNDLRLAHDLVLHLNNNSISPLKDMVKLLGRGPGLFSQAFFVEKIIPFFKKGSVWSAIFEDYLEEGNAYRKLPIFLRAYFSAMREAYSPYWPQQLPQTEGKVAYNSRQYKHNLCKSTGMGAFLRLIPGIYSKVGVTTEDVTKANILETFRLVTPDKAKELFSAEGKFATLAGESLQTKLYKELCGIMEVEC